MTDYDPFRLRELLTGELSARAARKRRRLAWGCFLTALAALMILWGYLIARTRGARVWPGP